MDGGKGRPPMTEKRKEVIRLEIAMAALGLFKKQGVAATSVERIAGELGMSTRTLWRYCSSKEDCVRPLLAHGVSVVVGKLQEWPKDKPLLDQLLHESQLYDHVPESTLDLVRLTHAESTLRSVWIQTHLDAERAFAEVIAERLGGSSDELETKVLAGMLNVALRIAVEHYAWNIDSDGTKPSSMTTTTRAALRTAIAGLTV